MERGERRRFQSAVMCRKYIAVLVVCLESCPKSDVCNERDTEVTLRNHSSHLCCATDLHCTEILCCYCYYTWSNLRTGDFFNVQQVLRRDTLELHYGDQGIFEE